MRSSFWLMTPLLAALTLASAPASAATSAPTRLPHATRSIATAARTAPAASRLPARPAPVNRPAHSAAAHHVPVPSRGSSKPTHNRSRSFTGAAVMPAPTEVVRLDSAPRLALLGGVRTSRHLEQADESRGPPRAAPFHDSAPTALSFLLAAPLAFRRPRTLLAPPRSFRRPRTLLAPPRYSCRIAHSTANPPVALCAAAPSLFRACTRTPHCVISRAQWRSSDRRPEGTASHTPKPSIPGGFK